MNIEEYPKLTVIMRGYSYEEAMLVIEVLTEFDRQVGVEVTTNNSDYLKIIRDGNEYFGNQVLIGVGTIIEENQAKEAIAAGAKFMLGPQKFNKEIFDIAKKNNVYTVPAAFTPTEITTMFSSGADIVKLFPAITLGTSYAKQLAGPFGKQKLMAVGGVSLKNIEEFKESGIDYFGIGSSMFNKEDLNTKNKKGLYDSILAYLEKIM